ncbi:MAG: hypothetical protein LC798_08815 [Chloroflexi bacterium]|nr:hypothetical protein [Chloroflexota bacterium]
MSAEAITDAVARHFAENVQGVKAAYASGAGGQGSVVKTLPSDIFDTPVAIVYWQRYELTAGSYEKVRHFVNADLYFGAADSAAAYKTYLPFVSRVIESFRANVGLFGTATLAFAPSSQPPETVNVNGKEYVRLTFEVTALETTITSYSAGS